MDSSLEFPEALRSPGRSVSAASEEAALGKQVVWGTHLHWASIPGHVPGTSAHSADGTVSVAQMKAGLRILAAG
jgi:hypothetical protein